MKKHTWKNTFATLAPRVLTTLAVVGLAIFGATGLAQAEGEEGEAAPVDDGRISISISPVVENFQLRSSSTYNGVMHVTNNGNKAFRFEVYSAPYTFSQGEDSNDYSPNFSKENNYTQIARWITIKDAEGNYVACTRGENSEEETCPTWNAEPGQTIDVEYEVNTPDNIPAGGQYATLFAKTISEPSNTSGITTEAALGLKVFGRSEEGEAIQSAEIENMEIKRTIKKSVEVQENGQTVSKEMDLEHINASALVKNTGNVDFMAKGVLRVSGLFGGDYYVTPDDKPGNNQSSVIPDTEMPVEDEWEDTPSFGIFRVNWTVTAGDDTQTVESVVFLLPPWAIVIAIIVLTIIIVGIIMGVRRHKERRSRFSV